MYFRNRLLRSCKKLTCDRDSPTALEEKGKPVVKVKQG